MLTPRLKVWKLRQPNVKPEIARLVTERMTIMRIMLGHHAYNNKNMSVAYNFYGSIIFNLSFF